MARKPIPDDEHRQRTLEEPDDGPLRARIRDADDERTRRAWMKGVLRNFFAWGAAAIVAVAFIRDEVLGVLRWLGSLISGGGGP